MQAVKLAVKKENRQLLSQSFMLLEGEKRKFPNIARAKRISHQLENSGFLLSLSRFTIIHLDVYVKEPITGVLFQFQLCCVTSWGRGGNQNFVAKSRCRFYSMQHRFTTCSNEFCCVRSWPRTWNTRSNTHQLAMQQCCAASWAKMLSVLLHLNATFSAIEVIGSQSRLVSNF